MLAALEVSTRLCSVALLDLQGVEAPEETRLADDVDSAAVLMPTLQAMLARRSKAPQDLAALAVSIGPGSFTGIRVGLASAQGFCLPSELPAFGIPTLDGLAENLRADGWFGEALCLIDAQRGECFVGHYQVHPEGFETLTPPRILAPAALPDIVKGRVWLVGPGALKYEAELHKALGTQALLAFTQSHRPRASSLARLAQKAWNEGKRPPASDLKPLYLRVPAPDEKIWKDGRSGVPGV